MLNQSETFPSVTWQAGQPFQQGFEYAEGAGPGELTVIAYVDGVPSAPLLVNVP